MATIALCFITKSGVLTEYGASPSLHFHPHTRLATMPSSKRQRSAAESDQLLPLPLQHIQALSGEIRGQPNIACLRAYHLAVGLTFALIGVGSLSLLLLPEMQGKPAIGIFLLLFIGALLLGSAYAILRRLGRPPHHELSVSDSGLHIRTPCSWMLAGTRQDTSMAWPDIVPSPDGGCDVETVFSTSKSIARDLVFWHRNAQGEIKMQRIPWQRFSPLTFANGEELKRALLLRLASKPGFRFAADVFVAARVNPVDWRPMRAPMRMQSLSLLASGALLTAVCLSMDTHQPLLQRSWPLLAALLACALGSMLLWRCLFPDLLQSIRFLPAEDCTLAKPCQDEKTADTALKHQREKC
ncbi:hypothetical protein JQK19_20980 [Chromobacterium violaceum]|nr:hypothetical protein [Chromobacterium violaceum]